MRDSKRCCPECQAPIHAGWTQCGGCGYSGPKLKPEVLTPSELPSPVVMIYVAILIGSSLLFPFILPFILKISTGTL